MFTRYPSLGLQSRLDAPMNTQKHPATMFEDTNKHKLKKDSIVFEVVARGAMALVPKSTNLRVDPQIPRAEPVLTTMLSVVFSYLYPHLLTVLHLYLQ
jgi:hypothetical protein